MSGDRLDLDAIEERHGKYATEQDCGPCFWDNPHDCTTLALVAEVRRLRARVEELEDDNTAGPFVDLRIPNPFGDDPPPIVVA